MVKPNYQVFGRDWEIRSARESVMTQEYVGVIGVMEYKSDLLDRRFDAQKFGDR